MYTYVSRFKNNKVKEWEKKKRKETRKKKKTD
jgi:hypothetical protein